jgi:hypothetical protein
MSANPNNPFDFTGASSLNDIFNPKTEENFIQLHWQGLRPDHVMDFFYDALEAPGVDQDLMRQAVDLCEAGAVKVAEDITGSTFQAGLDGEGVVQRAHSGPFDNLEERMLGEIQQVSQEASRIARIKGAETNPLLLAIAREVPALNQAEYESLADMIDVFMRAYQNIDSPGAAPTSFDFSNAKNVEEVMHETPMKRKRWVTGCGRKWRII